AAQLGAARLRRGCATQSKWRAHVYLSLADALFERHAAVHPGMGFAELSSGDVSSFSADGPCTARCTGLLAKAPAPARSSSAGRDSVRGFALRATYSNFHAGGRAHLKQAHSQHSSTTAAEEKRRHAFARKTRLQRCSTSWHCAVCFLAGEFHCPQPARDGSARLSGRGSIFSSHKLSSRAFIEPLQLGRIFHLEVVSKISCFRGRTR